MNLALGAVVAAVVLVMAQAGRGVLAHGRGRVVVGRLHGRAQAPSARPSPFALLPVALLPAPPARLVRSLAAAGVDQDPQRVWSVWAAAVGLVVCASVAVAGPGLALVAVLTAVAGPALALASASGRADRLIEDGLPDALEAMARSLRSGASLRQAVQEAAEATPGILGADLAAVAREVGHGGTLSVTLDRWALWRPLPGVRLATSALALGAETGGAQARALDGVAATLRSRRAVGREVRALSSQARMSGLVITLAPLGFSALAASTDERTAAFLLATPLGLVCLSVGLALDGLAALWMHRLSRVEA